MKDSRTRFRTNTLARALTNVVELKWMLDAKELALEEKIGDGQFGEVFLGELWGGMIVVIVVVCCFFLLVLFMFSSLLSTFGGFSFCFLPLLSAVYYTLSPSLFSFTNF